MADSEREIRAAAGVIEAAESRIMAVEAERAALAERLESAAALEGLLEGLRREKGAAEEEAERIRWGWRVQLRSMHVWRDIWILVYDDQTQICGYLMQVLGIPNDLIPNTCRLI